MAPTIISLNEGQVATLSAVAESATGSSVAADISFTSSNTGIATVSAGGLVCGGVWDNLVTPVNCNPTIGQGGVGQATITATATAFNLSATATVYVHEQVDQVQAVLADNCPAGPPISCTTMGDPIEICGLAYSTTAPGCSPAAPCDITSTVGPFSFGSNDLLVASTSSGIVPTFSSSTNTPVYISGGTITGSNGQNCNLSNFNGVVGATGTVALTGANVIANGTQLTITNAGHGATVAPTTATLSNGSATCSGTAVVSTSITNGVLTAQAPGATTLFASVSGVNSVGAQYFTCPVQSIVVHDASTNNTTFTLAPNGMQSLTADVYDTNNQYISPTLTWGSSSSAAATVSPGTIGNNPATVTAVTGGTTFITATCSFPDCNRNVPAQYSQNIVTVNVTTPASTTVYAAGTNSTSLVPITTSNNAVGTAVTLPYTPNSIFAEPSGAAIYLGSSTALMAVVVGSTTVTTYAVPGTIVGVSPNSQYLLISNGSGNSLSYFDIANGTVSATVAGTSSSSAYTPDSKFNEAVLANSTLVEFSLQTGASSGTFPLASNGTALDISGQGGLTYITSSSGAAIYAYSTCNQTLSQTLAATSPTLVKALSNGTGAVAADSPNIDLISTGYPMNAGCPIMAQNSINGYNLGVGSYIAQQLLVSYDAAHAYIISNLPELLSFDVSTLTPGTAALAGGATAYNGGITLDGSSIYVGTSDGTVHQINTSSMTDTAQIGVGLKDGNGNPTPPNLVAVVP